MVKGYCALVLHSHLPYVRRAGLWPHGEEMIHEAIAETYLPLARTLRAWERDRVPARLTLGLTPILLEQLADRDVLESFVAYAEVEIAAAERDVRHANSAERMALARFYIQFYRDALALFDEIGGDLVGTFRHARDAGLIDALTCAATHAYLPLLDRDSTIAAQLDVGRATSRRHLGAPTGGIWLPECAYRPAYYDGVGRLRPGIEEFLEQRGLTHFVAETAAVVAGAAFGKAAGDVLGPYGVPQRRVGPTSASADGGRSVLVPFAVRDSGVAVFGREPRTGLLVWSASQGYPGDSAYREFHRKDPLSGLQYWRVTGARAELADKALYEPAAARARVGVHARHFVEEVAALLSSGRGQGGVPPLVVAAFDTELFGHWWFEGVEWLDAVAREIAGRADVAMMATAAYLDRHPPEEAIDLPESSWGAGADHTTWANEQTADLWATIHEAERRMERLVALASELPAQRRALAQAAREKLLLDASDWPFLISTGQAAEYARERFRGHADRFLALARIVEANRTDADAAAYVSECERADNPFPDLDPRLFAARQGRAATY